MWSPWTGASCAWLTAHAYLVLNKPRGYVSTMSDPHGRPCVKKLVPTTRYPGLFPVGRLDVDTTGLLLFTTNGDAAQRMLHPSMHVWKHYVALVRGVPDEGDLARLRAGVMLDDGPAQPAEAEAAARRVTPSPLPVAPEGVPHAHAVVGPSDSRGQEAPSKAYAQGGGSRRGPPAPRRVRPRSDGRCRARLLARAHARRAGCDRGARGAVVMAARARRGTTTWPCHRRGRTRGV